jgi:hypothetical protein
VRSEEIGKLKIFSDLNGSGTCDLPARSVVPGYKPEDCGSEIRWGEILNLPNPSGRTRPWGLLSL